jgi:hypothetical protein
VLTENARTPAIAIRSAMPPSAENTNAFNRSGARTSVRISSSVAVVPLPGRRRSCG